MILILTFTILGRIKLYSYYILMKFSPNDILNSFWISFCKKRIDKTKIKSITTFRFLLLYIF